MCRDGRKGMAVKRETSDWVKQDPRPIDNEAIVICIFKNLSLFSSKHLLVKDGSYTNECKNMIMF